MDLILDSDDTLFEDKFFEVMSKISSKYDAIIGGQLAKLENGKRYVIQNHPKTDDLRREIIGGWIPNNPSSVLIQRKAYLRVGGMDECLKTCEDHDFWLRAILLHKLNIKIEEKLFSSFNNHSNNRLSLDFETRVKSVGKFLCKIKKYFPLIRFSTIFLIITG